VIIDVVYFVLLLYLYNHRPIYVNTNYRHCLAQRQHFGPDSLVQMISEYASPNLHVFQI